MKTTVMTLATVALLFGGWTGVAQAQPCCYRPVRVYRVQPVYSVRQLPPRPLYYRPLQWSAGLHLTGVTTNQKLGEEGVALGGVGGHLRYRGYRFGAELSMDVMGNKFLDGGVQRVSVPLQASALLYLIPHGVFNLYLLGGAQVVISHVQWDLPNLSADQTFTQFGLHGGVGAELNLTRELALTADLRFFGLIRNDGGDDGQYYQGIDKEAVVPRKSAGAQLNLGVQVRF